MPSRVFQPLVEVFLLVEQPRQRLSHWSQALAPLDDVKAPPVATVDAYYDPSSNQAIFGLRYDELALGPERLGLVFEVAQLAEIGMIEPAELSEADRRRFLGDRLAKCTVHVGDQRKIVGALVELVRRVRGQKVPASTSMVDPMSAILPRASSGLVPAVRARGDTIEPMALLAKGTRDDGSATDVMVPDATRELARGSVRRTKSQLLEEDTVPAGVPEAEQKRVISEPIAIPARQLAAALPPRRPTPQRPSPNVIARAGVHRAATVMLSTTETQQILEAAMASSRDRAATEESPLVQVNPPPGDRLSPATPPGPQAPDDDDRQRAESSYDDGPTEDAASPGAIYARYLRSGRWVPTRIGSLSLKGAALMAVALPLVDDRVDIALAYDRHRALVRGVVAKVSTTQEAIASGATAFHVSFDLDDASRRQLTVLLTAARAAKVTIKPPASRSARRYPVEWPVCLGTMRGAVRADALDVSTDGMFVKPLHALALDANLTFTAVLDDGLPPVSGRSRVVRNISEADARAVGLSPGYGLSIVDMAALDRERWCAFLARIEKRASKRVLIGAAPGRLAELQGGLVSAGYTATGSSDPGAFAQLASAEARPVDAALIDAGWLAASGSPSWVESLFSARNVPCVTMHGDARRARMAIDRLLSVA